MTRALTLTLLALLAGAPAVAQEHDHPPADAHAAGHHDLATHEGMPDGWLMRFDREAAGPDMAAFETMPPGWHVKTGRAGAGIFWMPEMAVAGPFTARSTFHLFNPASHAESFGLFLGGSALDAADQEYLYFLVRQTGEYLIKRRDGAETTNVVGWTRHDAIPVAPAGEPGPTRYDLAVEVGAGSVEFRVNGATVHTLPAAQVDADGVVGLRINHMLDIHVEELAVEGGR
jgi:hypothetical protein